MFEGSCGCGFFSGGGGVVVVMVVVVVVVCVCVCGGGDAVGWADGGWMGAKCAGWLTAVAHLHQLIMHACVCCIQQQLAALTSLPLCTD